MKPPTAQLCIEAANLKEAEAKARELGIYYEGVADGLDCECCGDRWYSPEESETEPDLTEGFLYTDYQVHYTDGRVKSGQGKDEPTVTLPKKT